MIDFTNPEAYAWYRDMHRPLFAMGISVMKTDYGEAVPEDVVGHNGDTGKRLHNVYSLLYNRCVFEASQMYGHQDGLVWGRSSWAGGQRYPVQWGGDPQSDWEGLAASIRGGLSWGMSGGAFYTHDIGGLYNTSFSSNFLGGGIVDAELYVRWTQAGIMTSHTRFHGTGPREPWEFAPEIEDLTRRWLGWRYQMIPYLQACAEEASLTGMPVMRAMPLAFPNQPLSWNFQTQYMLGPTLLVAAVVSPGGEVTLFLPDGDWYDIWTGEHLQGPQMLNLKMPLARIPIYGRGGAALLVGPAVQHTGELTPDRPVQRIIFGKQTFILSLRD
jgi:alpha-D-xyloside xylohydrolase